MKRINRRAALSALSAIGGASVMAGCSPSNSHALAGDGPASPASAPGSAAAARSGDASEAPGSALSWRYTPLEPAAVADEAYRIYPEGGCMYAVVGSVIRSLARQAGPPFCSFPVSMMRYGDGGVGGWGSLCGVVNGGGALIGLFHDEKPKQTREKLTTELCGWYETALLPSYEPAEPAWADEARPSVAGSLLCHVSVAQWCRASGCEAFSMAKKERCRRLAADGAAKITDILNRASLAESEFAELAPAVSSCIRCHGRDGAQDAMGKMQCDTCHRVGSQHPNGTRDH